ncbi:MAG: SDR family NAD(P)-dependent oxidoreductase [Chlamydiales bacterium]|nr:SDR family NAD(P)-dependent oxidoreductase [Chlamydiia bacterium]MCP5506860.1 SDR family NAD(P)-dependent oxidoreductase [Chlamydiales bacterium]
MNIKLHLIAFLLLVMSTVSADDKVILITGASRGIGLETVRLLSQNENDTIIATARTPEKAILLQKLADERDNIVIKTLDVASTTSVNSAINDTLRLYGKIDVVVNNAGYGVFGPVETITEEEMLHQYNVDVLGPKRITDAVLPSMRARNSGRIVNISSIVGRYPSNVLPTYSACKHDLEVITCGYAFDNAAWEGIVFCIIQPGSVATDFAQSLTTGTRPVVDAPYDIYKKNCRTAIDNAVSHGQPADEVAAVIKKAIEDPNPDFWYQSSSAVQQLFDKHYKDTTGCGFIRDKVQLSRSWYNE